MKNVSIVSKVGIIAGFLFFLHALVPFSHAWPLLWPALAGIVLVIILKNKGNLKDFSHALKSLLKASVLTASIFFVFTLIIIYILGFPQMNTFSTILGANGPIIINSALIVSLLIASAIGIITSLLTGSIFYPMIKK